ncbi:HAD-IIA family hydrolase [Marmoricola sp. RAF53]|uniref:HAD-IIA family hydrolase n=1 Tax=Marmoricola sp. RAF53 TaxID=3233059 RepID=UPI003F9C8EDC
MTAGSGRVPLRAAYDVAVLDLDGVVYVGPAAVPGAVDALVGAEAAGMHLAFVTNNASRPPEDVAAHLRELGIPAKDGDVVTSAQAAARLMARAVPAGSKVYVIGGPGLEAALRERGLVPVTSPADGPVAVVQGFGPDMPWRRVIDGAILVQNGLPWVASNIDSTVPTPRGPGPGNGALVDLVARFSGRTPVVAGKPEAALFEETLARVGGERPLMVGDRLDTDIDGALGTGWDSLLVMTGVTTLADLARLPADRRPTYVGADLGSLALPAPEPVAEDGVIRLGGWTARTDGGRLVVSGGGDRHDWWPAVAAALWAYRDTAGADADTAGVLPPG